MTGSIYSRTSGRRQTGAVYEKKAGAYLEEQGYVILQYNYRCRAGEVDIVARDGSFLVFCEVKYRRTAGKGGALDTRYLRVEDYLKMRSFLSDGASSDRRRLPL